MVRLSVNNKGLKVKVGKGGNFTEDKGIPENYIPIGSTGLYRSPDVVKPDDCTNYPSSPVCGGNPLTKAPIGLYFKPSVDSVGRVSISISPTLLFFKLPTTTIMYAPPGTRGEIPNDIRPREIPRRLDNQNFGHLNDNREYIISLDADLGRTVHLGCGIVSVGVAKARQSNANSQDVLIDPYPRATVILNGVPNGEVYRCLVYNSVPRSGLIADTFKIGELRHSALSQFPFLISGKGSIIKRYLSGNCGINTRRLEDQNYSDFVFNPPFWGSNQARAITIGLSKELETCLTPRLNDPIEPYYPPTHCCMSCCSPSPNEGKASDALLNKILKKVESLEKSLGKFPVSVEVYDADENKTSAQKKTLSIKDVSTGVKEQFNRVEKIGKIIGIDSLPVTVPNSIIEAQDKGFLGGVLDFFTGDDEKIENLIDLLAWKIKQDSAVMGQWQRKVVIADADASKKGSQEKKMILPDIASTLEELVKLNLLILKSSGLNVDIDLKALIEMSSTKALVGEALEIVKDVQNYMDYDTREESQAIPLQIKLPTKDASNIDKNDLHALLTPSMAYVVVKRWIQQDPSLEEKILTLLDGANAINANFKGNI